MGRKVRIKVLPKAKKGLEARTSGLEVRMKAGLGFNANQLNWPVMAGEFSAPDVEVNSTLKPVPRSQANLEAELGETAVTDLNGDGIPEHYKIGGKRHYAGGTPLYLPDNSFIFSRDKKMKIKDPDVLKQFGMPANKSGYTPAEIAKKYDINKFRKILGDQDSDDLQRKTAEAMIASYNMKLAKLALIQESMKGFPQGIPAIAMPYIQASGIDPASFIKAEPGENEEETVPEDMTEAQPEEEGEESVARYGANVVSQIPIRQMGGGTRKVKVTYPKFQTGGTSGITKYETYNEIYADPDYRTKVKEGRAYVKDETGKYRRVNYISPQPPKEAFLDNLGNYKDEYAYLYAEMADPNVQEALYKNFTKQIANVKNPALKKSLESRSKEQVVSDFLKMQKHNFTLQAKNINFRTDEWKNKNNPQAAYEKYITEAGETPLNAVETASAQAAYASLIDASNDKNTKNLFKGIAPVLKGESDEKYLSSTSQVSPPDAVYGDTTAGELARAKGVILGDEYTEEDKTTSTDVGKINHLGAKQKYTGKPEFWLQDVIKTAGAVGDYARLKKRLPWQATPGVFLPEPTFYDPTRELAAGQEQANALIEGLGAFTGPQALSARASQIQGNAAQQAANTLGKYANLNVGEANKFELTRTGILNQAAQQKAALATNLYDNTVRANEVFDNARAEARQNMRQSFIDALTNRANTYNLNTLYPQYAVDPMSGGIIDFTHGAGYTPEYDNTPDVGKIYQTLYDTYPTMRKNPDLLWKTASQMAGVKDDSSDLSSVLSQMGYTKNV